jgi:PiT family inorganic phosphate transporter
MTVTVLLLLAAALALAYANGANDNFKATATLYGAGTLDYERARSLATGAQLAGSAASVVLAGTLLRAFGGNGLVPAAVVGDPVFLVAVGLGAAATVWLATRVGLPISTTHALVGGLVGAGLALAPSDLSVAALGGSFFLPLLLSPLLAAAAAGVLYPLATRARTALRVSSETCVCLGDQHLAVDITPAGEWVMRQTGLPLTVGDISSCRQAYAGRTWGISIQTLIDRLHMGSAFSLGFARGLNDTPKVLALLVAAGWSGIDPRVSLVIVAGAMALGGWLHAGRVAETLAHRITSLSNGQGLLANGIASSLVIGASLMGAPVSTTHVSTGALMGIGVWNRETDYRMVAGILSAWLGTLPLAALLSAGVALGLGLGG